MNRAGIIGATGYAGAELVRILSGHPDIELTGITSRQYAGAKYSSIYPSMTGVVSLICEEFNMESFCDKVDIIFIALPHKIPMGIVPGLIKRGKKVIDLSADFRFKDVLKYEKHYQPHTAKELLKKAVYGLCEIYFDKIKNASLIGNPGCYPTSVLLPLVPLLKKDFLNINTIIADSKSGISGAGRSLSLAAQFCEANESFKAYKVACHRHCPEMEEILSAEAKKPVTITFVPHLVPMTRGMLTTTYVNLLKKTDSKEIRNCISSFYAKHPFIRICPENLMPDTLHVKGTNYCDIGFKIDERNNRLIIVSAIDNLVKGAAGQAVQNMNIMLGLDETRGLNNVPFAI
ncbi:MAG: N-acetyl-gamma-glutamyl-phosphate reductase [Deltaproteobacteria bacterium]|nr:N-acetyl-gamma-glutamyl-phosphate reductase [Deltaproteobacteria bacterium]MBW2661100.1 N-acetyl-gamma-glutamyl-phosphate reductase [Deltaproteobacteria bacterium]